MHIAAACGITVRRPLRTYEPGQTGPYGRNNVIIRLRLHARLL